MTMQMTPSILLALVLLFGTLIVFSSALPSDDDGDNNVGVGIITLLAIPVATLVDLDSDVKLAKLFVDTNGDGDAVKQHG